MQSDHGGPINDQIMLLIETSGLDPVNTLLIKELMYEMQAAGKTVIMSTHMMQHCLRTLNLPLEFRDYLISRSSW